MDIKLSPKVEPEIQNFFKNFNFSKFKQITNANHIIFPEVIERKIKEIKSVMREEDKIFLAMKSTYSKSLIKKAVELGCFLDVSTLNELKLAKELGCEEILAGGPKSSNYLKEAVKFATIISIDSIYELENIISMNSKCNILIRVNDLKVFNKEISIKRSRFGIKSSQIIKCLEMIKKSNSKISIKGIHFHSDGFSPEDRALFFNHIFDLFTLIRSYNHPVSIIDLGGSFNEEILNSNIEFEEFIKENISLMREGKNSLFLNDDLYGLEFDEESKTVKGVNTILARGIKNSLFKEIQELYETICIDSLTFKDLLEENNISLIIEPGYSLSTNCGISIFTVQGKKEFYQENELVVVNGHKFNISASMFSHISNPLIISFNDNNSGEVLDLKFENTAYIVGSLCREDDFLMNRKIPIPKNLNKNDLIVFINTGSYAMSYENCNPQLFETAQYLVYENKKLVEENK
ncbi:MAG: hypothetical protein HF967_10300 [Methanosarcinales archaeon]|nr:hypothetical protein [Methanosarcinales archaeon]